MTPQEQEQFIKQLMASVQLTLLTKIHKGSVPYAWDGVELRMWLADTFADNVMKTTYTRKKEYKNARLVNDL